jgi:hypothetical protein
MAWLFRAWHGRQQSIIIVFFFDEFVGVSFAFQSMAWSAAVDKTIELKRVMRQGEDKFVRVLNELRWGKVTAANTNTIPITVTCDKESITLPVYSMRQGEKTFVPVRNALR